jgi:hypothetical protein
MDEYAFREEVVIAAARQATGLADFGGDDFREGLRVLLATYDTTAGLSDKGRRMNWRRVVQVLATRLRITAALARHPEILERPLRKPVYITGLPRTGTSALFNLLALDRATRPLRLWEGECPDPALGLAPGQPDPRYLEIKARYERSREKNPELAKIHFIDADNPEECVLLTAHAFRDVQLGFEVLLEPYRSWFLEQDLRPTYRYYADMLRMLDWQRPGERWLLKSPAHLWAIDSLVELFPDACILFTHRNPLEVVGSYCSMMETLMASRGCSPQPGLGETVLDYLARSMECGLAARERARAERFLDVDYDRFVADPMATVRRVYDHFGLALDAQTESALGANARAHSTRRHGTHSYGLEKYGLTPERVKERLAPYIERFALPVD